jgi:Fe2+ or Zn2+ uptake regulation protein
MQSPSVLTQAFRDAGLKITPQRLLMFRLLEGNQSHPTAEALFEIARREMPSISLRTVYQTLNDLASMGELLQIDLGSGPGRFDPNTEDHHHFICDECGSIHDVQVNTAATLSETNVELQVRTVEVVFRGVCANCSHEYHPTNN